jgi:hypothetical protein
VVERSLSFMKKEEKYSKVFETFEEFQEEVEKDIAKIEKQKIRTAVYRFLYNIKEKFRTMINFFRNVIKYRKILAEDHDWDYYYILTLLRAKLNFVKQHQKNSLLSDDLIEKYTNQLDECIIRLDKLIDENYFYDEYTKTHDTLDNMFKETEEQKENVKNELFDMLKENIFYWWD